MPRVPPLLLPCLAGALACGQAEAPSGPVTSSGATGYAMIRVEQGSFLMGCDSGRAPDCMGHEQPAHEVTLTRPYLFGRTEVTQAFCEQVTGTNPARFAGDTRRPVESVSWCDAVWFANELSRREGLAPAYELPPPGGARRGGGAVQRRGG